MAISDFDFSGGFSPVDNQQFGVAAPDFGFSFSPDMQEKAYTSGLGVDTAKYGLDQQKKLKVLVVLTLSGYLQAVQAILLEAHRAKTLYSDLLYLVKEEEEQVWPGLFLEVILEILLRILMILFF